METRARVAALREFELARLVGDGDVAEGLMRLRIAERRAARRVPLPPQQSCAPEHEQQPGAQPSSSRRRGRRGKRESTCSAPSDPTLPADQPDPPVTPNTSCMPSMQHSMLPAAAADAAVTADAGADDQPPAQALPHPPGLDAIIRSSSESSGKRLHSPLPPAAPSQQAASPATPAAKRQLLTEGPAGLPPSSLPPSPPSSPLPSPPASPPAPPPRRPPHYCNTLLLPRQLVVKPSPPPKPPPSPKPSSRPLVYI